MSAVNVNPVEKFFSGFGVDINKVLGYKTARIVVVEDWFLGALAYSLQLAIVLYLVIWVIIVDKVRAVRAAARIRPGPARPGPARPGPARLGPARPGPARHGSARLGSARLG
eukprot:SAG22_NODE_663_length_8042_cov_12.157371_7_plen_111_part_01